MNTAMSKNSFVVAGVVIAGVFALTTLGTMTIDASSRADTTPSVSPTLPTVDGDTNWG